MMKRNLAKVFAMLAALVLTLGMTLPALAEWTDPVEYGVTLNNVNVDGVLKGQYAGQKLVVVCASGEFETALNEQIKYFEQLSGADVELRAYPWEELTSKIMLGFNGDEDMDVLVMVTSFMKGYNDIGYLADLNEVAGKYAAPSYDIKDFLAGLIASGSDKDGHLFAVPYQPTVFLFYYRKDLMEDPAVQAAFKAKTGKDLKVPETMEELKATAEFFTRSYNPDSPTTYGYAVQCRTGDSRWSWEHWLGSLGGNVVDADFAPAFVNGTGVQAMNFALDMMKYTSPETLQIGYDELGMLFGSGEAFMAIGWPGVYNQVQGSAVEGKVGYAMVPGGAPVMSGWAAGINKGTQNDELAWRFVEFCTSKDGEILKIKNNMHPTRTSNYQRPGIADLTEMYPALVTSLNATTSTMADVPVPYIGLQLNDILEAWTQKVYSGSATPEEAVNRMASEITEALKAVGLVK